MLLNWITSALTLALGIALLFRKPYKHFRLVQLYVFGSLALSLLHRNLFYNWNFYLFLIITQACLLLLAYWEVCRKMEGRTYHWVWPVLFIVAGVFFWPVSHMTKAIVPFYVVDTFIAFGLFFAFARKNPFLMIWTTLAVYSLSLSLMKTFIPRSEFLLIVGHFEIWTAFLAQVGLLIVVLWKPVARWLYGALKSVPVVAEAGANGATPETEKEIRPDRQPDKRYWQVVSKTMFQASILMRDLSKKEYLTPEELKFYLGMKRHEIEEFIHRHNIKKVYISEYPGTWLVRRKDVESIHS